MMMLTMLMTRGTTGLLGAGVIVGKGHGLTNQLNTTFSWAQPTLLKKLS